MTAVDLLSIPVMLDNMQMLFWRLDLAKQSFVNLNVCSVGVLGRENYRFFKDSDYREKMLLPDDRLMLDQAMLSFRERRPVRMVFRVSCENSIFWFKLTGWPTDNRRYYEGAVEDISDHINRLKDVFDQQSERLLNVEDNSYPVALFSKGLRGLLVEANQSFHELFTATLKSKYKIRLEDLVAEETFLPPLFEQLMAQRSMKAELTLKISSHQKIKVCCQLGYFIHDCQAYVRMAIISPVSHLLTASDKKQQSAGQQALKKLCDELTLCDSIDAMLDQVYASKDLLPETDVVMFSDIYARKNKVFVYSSGEMNEPLAMGAQFPYAGTIAENIEKENLEYLIVDDTQSSIKAIDWMLFVPQGIYSYVAKALYVRGAMRTVLIFCSKKKHAFSDDQITTVEVITKAFQHQLKQIRKKSKSSQ